MVNVHMKENDEIPQQSKRLGRRGIRRDLRTLQLAKYTSGLAAPPTSCDWTKGLVSWGVLDNDTLGCCTISGAGHATQAMSLNASTEVTVTDAEVLAAYEAWCGYDPADPNTDQGGIELDVLNLWRKQGFAGKALDAYCAVDVGTTVLLKQAVATFGGLYIGFLVPNYIMENTPQVWDVPTPGQDAGIDGGHCVWVVGYDDVGLTFISWGNVYKMTWAFWAKYVDEAYALISTAFLNGSDVDPSGVDLAGLNADLAEIKLGPVLPGATIQFTVTVTPSTVKVDSSKVQVTVSGVPDYSAVLSSGGLVVTIKLPSSIAAGTQGSVAWVYGAVTALATFTVGAA